MSFQIPKTFHGAGYAVCAVLFFVSFMSNVKEKFRVAGIVSGLILFIVVTVVYAWDRNRYYEDIRYRPSFLASSF
jgi:hypothetical protein